MLLRISNYYIKDVTSDMPTGIESYPTTDNKKNDHAWYTLTGVKSSQKPTQSGIYIHQGKKVVIK